MSAVLVVRPSSLGDVVYALAIVSDIKEHLPGCAVDWVAERAFVPLVRLDARVRHVIAFGLRSWRERPLSTQTWADMRAFRRDVVRERYTAVLNLQEQVKGALVSRLARGTRHGFDRASVREVASTWFDHVHHHAPRPMHFVQRCRVLAAGALGYRVSGPPRWQLRAPRELPIDIGRPHIVALHMSSRADKWWPDERWREALAHFAHAGYAVVLPWGTAAEGERSRAIANGIEHAVVPSQLPLPQVAALLQSAELVVGVDTGLTHLAAALRTPTLAVFTSTDAAQAGVAVTGNGIDLGGNGMVPSVADVIAAGGRLLSTQPRC
ncbi:MAG TPA: lipopolysaccharide heptosyltransferase I [Casimicrobiaceae bacterium]|nr:lipopolysaccharide heptosyltransferase I [Casimicrobiaceae bacterium]